MEVAFFSGEVLRLGQSSRNDLVVLSEAKELPSGRDSSPGSERRLVFIVPLRFVSALLEFEAKVLPVLDIAYLGEGHPNDFVVLSEAKELPSGTDSSLRSERRLVVLGKGGPKAPFGVKSILCPERSRGVYLQKRKRAVGFSGAKPRS